MTSSPSRPVPVGAYLALYGAVISLVAMALPSIAIDQAAVARGVRGLVAAPEVQRMVEADAKAAVTTLNANLGGLHAFPGWVALQLLIGLATGGTAFLIIRRAITGRGQRGLFALATCLFASYPFVAYLGLADDHPLEMLTATSLESLTHPAIGTYLAFLAAALTGFATWFAHVGDEDLDPIDGPEQSTPSVQAVLEGRLRSRRASPHSVAPHCDDAPIAGEIR